MSHPRTPSPGPVARSVALPGRTPLRAAGGRRGRLRSVILSTSPVSPARKVTMFLSELESLIEEVRMDVGEDADPEVRLAHQPTYPLAFHVGGIAVQPQDVALDDDDQDDPNNPDNAVVWIVEGCCTDDPYGVPRDVWDAARR